MAVQSQLSQQQEQVQSQARLGAGCGMAGVLWWWGRPQQSRDVKWGHCLAQVKHTAQRMANSHSHTGLLLRLANRASQTHSLSHRIRCTAEPESLIWEHKAPAPVGTAGNNTELTEIAAKNSRTYLGRVNNDIIESLNSFLKYLLELWTLCCRRVVNVLLNIITFNLSNEWI